MKCWIAKKFDRREVGTPMFHLSDSTAKTLLKKGILTSIEPKEGVKKPELVASSNPEEDNKPKRPRINQELDSKKKAESTIDSEGKA